MLKIAPEIQAMLGQLAKAQERALLLLSCPKKTVKVKQKVLLCALILLYYYFPVLQITAKSLKNDKHSTFMQSTVLQHCYWIVIYNFSAFLV